MGELKINYSDKKATPFGGMKLLKDFIDKSHILEDLRSVDLPYPNSNAGINPLDIIKPKICNRKSFQLNSPSKTL